MKKTVVLLALSGALLCAADGVPSGAVQSSAYAWSYTDAQGKQWIYRQTPFGMVKVGAQAAPVAPDANTHTTVTDLGDSVKFERDMPFGKTVWTKYKSALNSDELSLLKSSQEKE
jgi:hypothetical protein